MALGRYGRGLVLAVAIAACGPSVDSDVEEFPEVCATPGPVRLVETFPNARVKAMRIGDRYVVHEGVPYESAPERLTVVGACGEDPVDLTPSVEFSYDPVVVIGPWLVGCSRPAVLLDPWGERPPIELFDDAGCGPHPGEVHPRMFPPTSGGISAVGGSTPRRELWHHPAPEDPSVAADLVIELELQGVDELELPTSSCPGPGGCNYLHHPPPEPTHAWVWIESEDEAFVVDAKTGAVGPTFARMAGVIPIGDPRYVVLMGADFETYYGLREWTLLELETGVVRPLGRFQGGSLAPLYPWIVGHVGATSASDLAAVHVESEVIGTTRVGPGTTAIAALSDDAIVLGGDRFAVFWPAQGRLEEHPEAGNGWDAVNVDEGVLVRTLDAPAEGLWFVRADTGEVELVSRRIDSPFGARRNGVAVFIEPTGAVPYPRGRLIAVELDGTEHVIADVADWFELVGDGNAEVLFGVADGPDAGVWRSTLP